MTILAERTWTELFDFPPTFELVARHVFDRLSAGIAGLAYVELLDKEFNVRTRYIRVRGARIGWRALWIPEPVCPSSAWWVAASWPG